MGRSKPWPAAAISTAVHYAQNLDGTNVFVGLVLVVAALLFGWFMISAGASVFMVSVKAIYTTAKLLPSVFAGGISGAAQRHAKATVWRCFKHSLEAMVLITFVSVMVLAIERLISRPLPAELGGASPFAHILAMGGASMTALYLLRHIRADLDGRAPGNGFLSRAADVAAGMGMHAALGGTGKAVLGGAHGLRNSLGGGKTPWERLDEQAAASPDQVLGPPQEGFAPVPTESGGPAGAAGETSAGGPGDRGPATGGVQTVSAGDLVAPGVDPLTHTAGANAAARGPRRERRRSAAPAAAHSAIRPLVSAADWVTAEAGAAADVPPISDTPMGSAPERWNGEPPLAAYADHTFTDVPLPPEPAEDLGAPAPPEDPGPRAASVDSITTAGGGNKSE